MELQKIACIRTDFPEKFGIPRQSGLADTEGVIIFEPEYRNPDSIRGIGEYSRIWLIWGFSETPADGWSPTVRPPRLGGNRRVGVFASRSPFRPNPIGLSCVKLERVEADSAEGPRLYVTGADLKDGTPIYDIKPYLPYVDAYPQEKGGFAEERKGYRLGVEIPEKCAVLLDERRLCALRQILSQDPRPAYQDDPNRVYGMKYAGFEIRFQVKKGVLTVLEISN